MSGAGSSRPGPRCRGLALIVVLWAVVLLVLLAAGFSFSLRTEARLSAGVIERARAGAAAEAGVRRLMVMLATADRRRAGPYDARMRFDAIEVTLRMEPESARADLNAAPARLLEGLVAHVASTLPDAVDAAAIADAILDWRDTDSVARRRGAEARDYNAAGRTSGPRNGAFLSVSELSRVLGVPSSLYQALAPLVTVHAWSPRVDALSASRDLLLAVPGLDAARVDAFIARRGHGADGRGAMSLLAGAERYLASGGSGVFSLSARAVTAQGVNATRRAVVKLTGSAARPLTILAWFDQSALLPALPADSARPAAGRED